MPKQLRPLRQQAGLNLLEVLIATVVLSAGLLGLAGLQIAGLKTTHNSYQMQQATWLAYDLVERMRANRQAALDGHYLLPNTGAQAAAYCQTNAAPAKNCGVNTCNGQELAGYDLHNLLCGSAGSSSINQALLDGVLSIDCPPLASNPAQKDCRQGVRVNLQWQERNPTRQADMDGNTDGSEAFSINLTAIL